MLCRPADKPGMRDLFSAGAGSAPVHRQSQGIFCQGEELAQFSDSMLNARRKRGKKGKKRRGSSFLLAPFHTLSNHRPPIISSRTPNEAGGPGQRRQILLEKQVDMNYSRLRATISSRNLGI